MQSQPFFTIGVTVYKRRDLIKDALNSILNQSFSNFEILIGNDYPEDPIDLNTLGINDPRIIVINHKTNMGEISNMNFLLNCARGKYFSWIADDDFYEPDCFKKIYAQIIHYNSPEGLFAGCKILYDFKQKKIQNFKFSHLTQIYSGPHFLSYYLKNPTRITPLSGFFEKNALKSIQGASTVCGHPVELYGEFVFLLKYVNSFSAVYIDEPLVGYRAHPGSFGIENDHPELYWNSGLFLLDKTIDLCLTNKFLSVSNSCIQSVIFLIIHNWSSKEWKKHKRVRFRVYVSFLLKIIEKITQKSNGIKMLQFLWITLRITMWSGVVLYFKYLIKSLLRFTQIK